MKGKITALIALTALTYSCHLMSGKNANENEVKEAGSGLYLIETTYGNMTVKLYDETPLHKKNFEELVAKQFFEGLLFHRVIKDFMIQGGDPNSKDAAPNEQLGSGGPGYTIPAEINEQLIHKKGALAAARQSDQVNPERASSGSQFYIVHGKPVPAAELTNVEAYINNGKRQYLGYSLFNAPMNAAIKEKVTQFQQEANKDSMNVYLQKIEEQINDSFPKVEFKYSQEAKQIYQTQGGTPQLDAAYTIFGEVTEGLDIIDSIAKVPTLQGDRPVEDIIMSIKKI